ncbi:MAG: FAD binding domain-containing protein, partial [Myxococcota bacterium]|nr:FAD binding domain-containing protein [Myxococcota bacterium]
MAAGMTLPRFSFEAPDSVGAACSLLAQARGDARPMAGGTDLLVKMKAGLLAPKAIVSLARVPGLDAVKPSADGGLRIGALAAMATLAAHPTLRGPWAALAEGAGSVGGPIVRNRATVGGNIVSARPCADTAPPLIALGAKLHLAGAT